MNARPGLQTGTNSVFVAVESLYSMDGTIAPLTQIVEMLESLFPRGNGYLIVDEAHSTGVYGPQGRGMVAKLGLENKVLARLHTFGKALAGSGGEERAFIATEQTHSPYFTAVLLTSELIRDYMLNYARSLIYTTSLSYANIIAIDCSFDLLENGTSEKVCSQSIAICLY